MCLSRFLRINSGLRRMNSRFGPPPEFVRNGLIYLAVFAAGWGMSRANRKSSRFYGKNRELLSRPRSALAPQVLVFQGAPPGGADGVLALLESREIALDASGVPILL
jgi:hypothetical protein